jgi:hypothetical protein
MQRLLSTLVLIAGLSGAPGTGAAEVKLAFGNIVAPEGVPVLIRED